MTTVTMPVDVGTHSPTQFATDTLLIVGRNLRKLTRIPGLLAFTTVQPIMFLLLFAYVFGGVARVPGITYREYIVPAVLIQTITFSAGVSAVGLANDLQTGMIDRFRSLPIARAAFLVSRTVSDTIRMAIQVTLLLIVAVLIGFRFHQSVFHVVAMIVLALLFGGTLTTFFAWVGLTVGNPETAQVAGFLPTFPLIFASSAFAPVATLPSWLRGFASVNPVTAAIDSIRGLAVGGLYSHHLVSSVWHTLLAVAIIASVFTWLAVRRYRRI